MRYFILIIFLTIILVGCGCGTIEMKPNIKSNKSILRSNLQNDEALNWPWRGITVVSHRDREKVTEEAIHKLSNEGVNLIRLRLSFRKYSEREKSSLEESWTNTIMWAKTIISYCDKNNISVLISHTDFPIDFQIKEDARSKSFWNSPANLTRSLESIRKIVEEFDDIAGVVAYEFFSEPVVKTFFNRSIRPENWFTHFNDIIIEIRKASNKYILFSPGPWANCKGYQDMEAPFSDEKIIYNFHFYYPHKYTHQGIKTYNESISYIQTIDKPQLEEHINIVYDWAVENNVDYVFAGEFSAIRWAEGKDAYLNDVLEIFERKKIGWAYFSFNGWKGWDYNTKLKENSAKESINLIPGITNTSKLLSKYWGLNKVIINE